MPDLTVRENLSSHLIKFDGGYLKTIDKGFEEIVLAHLVGNYFHNKSFPLFLSIQGKMGEGKTFQTINVCKNNNINTYYYSGSELSGAYEKDSISKFSEEYELASNKFEMSKQISAFIIDDFHLSIASIKQSTGVTVNSQILIGYLMNLADSTKANSFSVPIILLANNFENLYSPLTRDGRMDFYSWNPSVEQKIAVISQLFYEFINNDKSVNKSLLSEANMAGFKSAIKKWVEDYKEQPISFFTEVKNDILKIKLKQLVKNYIGSSEVPRDYKKLQVLVTEGFEKGRDINYTGIEVGNIEVASTLSTFKEKRRNARDKKTKVNNTDNFNGFFELLEDMSKQRVQKSRPEGFD